MIYAKEVPPEIWSLIFDFTLDASVTAHEICNYTNFPQLNHHLRFPRFHPAVDRSWENLRLVCRGFNELAGKSPHCFLSERQGFVVSASTRASYIGALENIMACMGRLAESPIKHHQIATLNIIRGYSHNPIHGDPLQFLEYAAIFPNLRTLAVDLTATFDALSAWRRLNDSFPLLTCLVLRGDWRNVIPPPAMIEPEPVVFERVEILELDRLTPGLWVEFPRLQYLSLESFSVREMMIVTRWQSINALLLRGIGHNVSLDWKQLPNLRMLGVPVTHLHLLSGCPVDHPWSNLCISVGSYWAPRFINTVIELRSTTRRVAVDPKLVTPAELDVIARGCVAAGLKLVDSPYSRFQRGFIYIGTKFPPSVAYAFTQGIVDAIVTGLLCCFVCAAGLATCCTPLRRRRPQV